MSATLFSSSAPTPVRGGRWQQLLRQLGLEAWFHRGPNGAPAGREERLFLLLQQVNSQVPGRLAAVLAANQAAIEAAGGELSHQRNGRVLLSWPAGHLAPLLTTYEQLQASLPAVCGSPASLRGAATLGWVTRRAGAVSYCGAVLAEVTGILHEACRLESPLLVSAALHLRLAECLPRPCELHVAFRVPGHRYPATLYRVLYQ